MKWYASIVLLMGVLTVAGCSARKSLPNDKPELHSSYHQRFFNQVIKNSITGSGWYRGYNVCACARDSHFKAIAYDVRSVRRPNSAN